MTMLFVHVFVPLLDALNFNVFFLAEVVACGLTGVVGVLGVCHCTTAFEGAERAHFRTAPTSFVQLSLHPIKPEHQFVA